MGRRWLIFLYIAMPTVFLLGWAVSGSPLYGLIALGLFGLLLGLILLVGSMILGLKGIRHSGQ